MRVKIFFLCKNDINKISIARVSAIHSNWHDNETDINTTDIYI